MSAAGEGRSVLSRAEARRVYDRIGPWQDTQRFYEGPATSLLLRVGRLDADGVGAVFELGCGTGRLAEQMLAEQLAPTARYRGVDLSPRMVALARRRLAPWADRAEVVLTEGDPPTDEPADAYDRFLSTYVLDLLSPDDARSILREAHRMLRTDGLLCLAGLSTGERGVPRAISRSWAWVERRWPSLVGGCRPIDLLPMVAGPRWEVVHHAKPVSWGITSEVLVARRIQ